MSNTDRPIRIYLASSWRNNYQSGYVSYLRGLGCEVYDFKNPRPGDTGFSWAEIDENWEAWTVEEWRESLTAPVAEAGYKSDYAAMEWCDAMVLLLPSGRSAHLELGWAVGAGKKTCYVAPEKTTEPELMVKMCDYIATSQWELGRWIMSLSVTEAV